AGRQADIYLDQNIGAEDQQWPDWDPTALRLAGLDYVLIRDDIRGARPSSISSAGDRVPKVLAVFGGTDPYGASPVMTEALVRTGRPFKLTVVASRSELVDQIDRLSPGPDQHINVIAPTDRFAALAAEADLVISAAGSSSWELLCLGSAVAFVCVADNQRDSYARVIESGYGYALGYLEDAHGDLALATEQLTRALSKPEERLALREKARSVIDGRGRTRVADALLNLIS
ncbi:MAG TPA: spore coat protein, partial [Marmoricola sp.]|nr:spore coat protein [Marmoricola sp.]